MKIKSERIQVLVTPALRTGIKQEAQRRGLSMSSLLLSAYLKETEQLKGARPKG